MIFVSMKDIDTQPLSADIEADKRIARTTPDLLRPGVGRVLSSEWTMGSPERLQTAAEIQVATWRQSPWPDGLFSYGLYVGTDGDTLLHYSQWESEDAYHRFGELHWATRVDHVDDAVPGIQRHGVTFYRLYRSVVAFIAAPGLIVTEKLRAKGPVDAEELAKVRLDTVETRPPRGLIASHHHISTDGTVVLDYTEWTDEQAFVESGHGGRVKSFRPFAHLTDPREGAA